MKPAANQSNDGDDLSLAKRARDNAISFEGKKDGLQQRQSGDWSLRLTVAAADMDQRLTRASMGTRFICVLVEIGDDETPIDHKVLGTPQPGSEQGFAIAALHQPGKATDPQKHETSPDMGQNSSQPRPRRSWDELTPTQQAGIRCGEPMFEKFMHLHTGYEKMSASEAVRDYCQVETRMDLTTIPEARKSWQRLEQEYREWIVQHRED